MQARIGNSRRTDRQGGDTWQDGHATLLDEGADGVRQAGVRRVTVEVPDERGEPGSGDSASHAGHFSTIGH